MPCNASANDPCAQRPLWVTRESPGCHEIRMSQGRAFRSATCKTSRASWCPKLVSGRTVLFTAESRKSNKFYHSNSGVRPYSKNWQKITTAKDNSALSRFRTLPKLPFEKLARRACSRETSVVAYRISFVSYFVPVCDEISFPVPRCPVELSDRPSPVPRLSLHERKVPAAVFLRPKSKR
jgi:hypothetical protein